MKFFYCKHCGNVIAYTVDSGVKVVCCGDEMQELIAGTVDASKEKHIPMVSREGNLVTVKVGSVAHPMTKEHHIAWIALETSMATSAVELDPLGQPEAKFALLEGDEVVAAYEYCNLHGLWKA